MIRALLDANVLISAAIRPSGPPGQIIAALLTQSFDLILSPRIIEEVVGSQNLGTPPKRIFSEPFPPLG